MKKLDLVGQRFGNLYVLTYTGTNRHGCSLWECKCGCGNTKIIRGTSLVNGNTKSCGCLPRRPLKNLIGKRFGKLIVLSLYGKHGTFHKWNCKCDCGNTTTVFGHQLGRTKSCGCLSKENNKKMDEIIGKRFNHFWVLRFSHSDSKGRYYRCRCDCGNVVIRKGYAVRSGVSKSCGCLLYSSKDLTGEQFGSWTVLRLSDTQKRRRTWRCRCVCGVERDVMVFSLKDGSSKSCGCITQYESHVATEVKKYFSKYYGGIPEYRVCKNPRTNYFLRCDIYLPSHKTYIEIHGDQHYRPNNSFHKNNDKLFSYRKGLDELKKSYAQEHGTYIEVDLRKIHKVEEAISYIEQRL